MVRNFPATDILPEQTQTGVPRKRRQRTPLAGRPPQAVRHQSRSDQPSSLITAEMSSVKTAEANRNRRQICALTPFRLASSCATISAEFGETFLPFIALPPKRAKSPYRWRGWAFRILAAAQLHAVMTAIAVNSFRPNPTQREGGRACNAHSAVWILAFLAGTHLLFLLKGLSSIRLESRRSFRLTRH